MFNTLKSPVLREACSAPSPSPRVHALTAASMRMHPACNPHLNMQALVHWGGAMLELAHYRQGDEAQVLINDVSISRVAWQRLLGTRRPPCGASPPTIDNTFWGLCVVLAASTAQIMRAVSPYYRAISLACRQSPS